MKFYDELYSKSPPGKIRKAKEANSEDEIGK